MGGSNKTLNEQLKLFDRIVTQQRGSKILVGQKRLMLKCATNYQSIVKLGKTGEDNPRGCHV